MERGNDSKQWSSLPAEPDVLLVMECVFGLGEHHVRVYSALLEMPGSTVEELAGELERDRSNVSRSLATLHEKGLIERHRRLLEGGGYVYQYLPVPLEEAKALMRDGLADWCERVDGIIEGIDQELAAF